MGGIDAWAYITSIRLVRDQRCSACYQGTGNRDPARHTPEAVVEDDGRKLGYWGVD